jgi:hypothetical protein
VILIVKHGLDVGHPTARPVEPDQCWLVVAGSLEAFFVRLPAMTRITDGSDGRDIAYDTAACVVSTTQGVVVNYAYQVNAFLAYNRDNILVSFGSAERPYRKDFSAKEFDPLPTGKQHNAVVCFDYNSEASELSGKDTSAGILVISGKTNLRVPFKATPIAVRTRYFVGIFFVVDVAAVVVQIFPALWALPAMIL